MRSESVDTTKHGGNADHADHADHDADHDADQEHEHDDDHDLGSYYCNGSSCTFDACTTTTMSTASTETSDEESGHGVSARFVGGLHAQARRVPRRGGIGPRTSRLSAFPRSREGGGMGGGCDKTPSYDATVPPTNAPATLLELADNLWESLMDFFGGRESEAC